MKNKIIRIIILLQKYKQKKKIYRDIRIINSYERVHREEKWSEYKEENENEKEIKENCKIKINNKIILFSYFYRFNKEGYTIFF